MTTTITWIEHLRCRLCDRVGDAELFEIGPFQNGVRKLPEGFKVVAGRYGEEFYCEACYMPVEP